MLCASVSFAKPLTFVTYHATSQYYPTMSANAIFNAVPYGGKLILKVEPEVEKIKAKKSLKANNLVAEGDVQFGGTTATKGTLSMHNVTGRAKGLEAVDAHINNLYLYGVKFPQPTAEVMQWQELTLENGYTATFLTQGSKEKPECTKVGPPKTCTATISQEKYYEIVGAQQYSDATVYDVILAPNCGDIHDAWAQNNTQQNGNTPPDGTKSGDTIFDIYIQNFNFEPEVIFVGNWTENVRDNIYTDSPAPKCGSDFDLQATALGNGNWEIENTNGSFASRDVAATNSTSVKEFCGALMFGDSNIFLTEGNKNYDLKVDYHTGCINKAYLTYNNGAEDDYGIWAVQCLSGLSHSSVEFVYDEYKCE